MPDQFDFGTCANCQRRLTPVPSAPHKRFCSTGCRMAYHARRRQSAFDLLRKLEATEQNQEKDPQP